MPGFVRHGLSNAAIRGKPGNAGIPWYPLNRDAHRSPSSDTGINVRTLAFCLTLPFCGLRIRPIRNLAPGSCPHTPRLYSREILSSENTLIFLRPTARLSFSRFSLLAALASISCLSLSFSESRTWMVLNVFRVTTPRLLHTDTGVTAGHSSLTAGIRSGPQA